MAGEVPESKDTPINIFNQKQTKKDILGKYFGDFFPRYS